MLYQTLQLLLHGNTRSPVPVFISIICCTFSSITVASVPVFTDVSGGTSGVNVQLGGNEFDDTGGGATWIDFNNDGYPDLFVPNNVSGAASWLYQNNQDGSFTDVAVTAGATLTNNACTGAIAADYDNDGYDDLFVTCGEYSPSDPAIEENVLLRNKGDGTFENVTTVAGLGGDGTRNPSYAAAFGDLDGDNDLDLYVGGYTLGGFPTRTCEPNNLYINNGDGTFTDKAVELGLSDAGCTLGVTLTDYDHDGDLDIFVINDFSPESGGQNPPPRMYRNDNGGQVFTEVTQQIGLNNPTYGMGVASDDYDNDGDIDYYVTNIGANYLYENIGSTFQDQAANAGVEDATVNGGTGAAVGWGAAFFDSDNDGDQDLYVVDGAIGFFGGGANQASNPNAFFLNNGDGTFADVGAQLGIDDAGLGRSVIVADYDQDGDVDFFITNIQDGTSRLFRNDTVPGNKSLTVRLVGTASNNRGIGAKVRVTSGHGRNAITRIAEVYAGSSHGSSNSLDLHFGIARSHFAAQIVVEWPSGCVQVLNNVSAGITTITEDCSPPHVITGRVTYQGAGLAGFTLWDVLRWPAQVTTDSAGFYTLTGYPDGQFAYLNPFAARPGFQPSPGGLVVNVGTGDSSGNNFVAVQKAGTVAGYFETAGGDGVANMQIWDALTWPGSITRTDSNGLYLIEGFNSGATVLLVPFGGRSGLNVNPGSEVFSHSGGAEAGHDFSVGLQSDTISGSVRLPGGLPLLGATLWDVLTWPDSIVTTDVNGFYVMDNIGPGTRWINPWGTQGFSFSPASDVFQKGSEAAIDHDFVATPD